MGVVKCHPLRADEMAVLPLNSLPLGFRFRPTDEELIDYYLRQKINGNGDDVWVIREIDVCKWEPCDLPALSVIRNKDPEWFFFCPQDRKYPNGHRLNRATNQGYWKATGKDRKIKSGSTLIGMKKTLVYYEGRAPKGKRTHWVMHEYRPTLKELDGTNPGQNAYVLCRLFKKQDESLEASNCDEAERTMSTFTAANYSPEEIQSDAALVAVSPLVATEGDKLQMAPLCISENTEETTSNIITPVDFHSDGCDAYDAQNQIVETTTADEDPLLNLDIFFEPMTEPWDERLFSPVHLHMPHHPVSNESDGHCGLPLQYGINEANISEFLDSVNWDELSREDCNSQKPTSTLFSSRDNVSGSDSGVEMANITYLQALHAVYPEEAIDRRAPSMIETTPEFGRTITSDLSSESNIGLFQNNSQTAWSSDVALDPVYNVFNGCQESGNYNTVVSGDNSTGIRTLSRQVRNEQINPEMFGIMKPIHGTAPRRIRLQIHGSPLSSNEMAKEDRDSKPIIPGESKGSETDEDGTDTETENEPPSPESTDSCKIFQQLVPNEDSVSGLKKTLLCKSVLYPSKASSRRTIWPSFYVFSVILVVFVILLANILGYLKF